MLAQPYTEQFLVKGKATVSLDCVQLNGSNNGIVLSVEKNESTFLINCSIIRQRFKQHEIEIKGTG